MGNMNILYHSMILMFEMVTSKLLKYLKCNHVKRTKKVQFELHDIYVYA